MSRARDLAAFVSNADGDIKFDTDTLFIDSSANRVGIGTSSPAAALQVSDTSNDLQARFGNLTAGLDPSIRFQGKNVADTNNRYADIKLNANDGIFTIYAPAGSSPSIQAINIDTSGNVGVGTSSPAGALDISGGDVILGQSKDLKWMNTARDTTYGVIEGLASGTVFKFGSTEHMRIDSSGNLLVGKTTTNNNTVGAELNANGSVVGCSNNVNPAMFNRKSSDGDIVVFRKDGTTVGSILSRSSLVLSIVLDPRTNGSGITGSTLKILPTDKDGQNLDNAVDLGSTATRWDDVYATNGTIQTSDRNEKQDIAELDEAEKRVATAAKGLIRKYRWIDAVQEKGDDARIHVGIIAQDLQAAFEAEGLDASRYAMFISSTWWEADEVIPAVEAREAVYETQTDEEGNETQVLVSEAVEAQPERTVTNTYETQEEAPEGATERTRLGVRYPELLAFIIGAM